MGWLALVGGCQAPNAPNFAPVGADALALRVPIDQRYSVSVKDGPPDGDFDVAMPFAAGIEWEHWLGPIQTVYVGLAHREVDLVQAEKRERQTSLLLGGRTWMLPGPQPVGFYAEYGLRTAAQTTVGNGVGLELGVGAAVRLTDRLFLRTSLVHELPVIGGDESTLPLMVQGTEYRWQGTTWIVSLGVFL